MFGSKITVKNGTRPSSRYVGHGTYGCVMRPATRCDGSIDRSAVSKLYDTDASGKNDMRDEYALGQKIRKSIDPDNVFTLAVVEACEVSSAAFDIQDLVRCDNMTHFKRKGSRQPKVPQMVVRDGGIDLSKLVKDKERMKEFPFDALIRGFWRLFYGLQTLEYRDTIHLDIKPANIVAKRTGDGKVDVRLIDFGLSETKTNFFNIKNRDKFRHPYAYYPPEYGMIEAAYAMSTVPQYRKAIVHDPRYKQNIELTLRKLLRKLPADRSAMGNEDPDVANLFRELRDFVREDFDIYADRMLRQWVTKVKYVDNPKHPKVRRLDWNAHGTPDPSYKVDDVTKVLEKRLQTNWQKIDVYSLGISIIEITKQYALHRLVDFDTAQEYAKLVWMMTRADPDERISVSEAYEIFLEMNPDVIPDIRYLIVENGKTVRGAQVRDHASASRNAQSSTSSSSGAASRAPRRYPRTVRRTTRKYGTV